MIGIDDLRTKLCSPLSVTLLICVLGLCSGCKKKIDNGYHVVAYNSTNEEWTVIDKDFDSDLNRYHRKRFVLVCDSYEYNRGDFEHGPGVCDIHVGDVFRTDSGDLPGRHVYVDPSNTNPGSGDPEFYVSVDEGDTHEVQFFRIVREEVIPDER